MGLDNGIYVKVPAGKKNYLAKHFTLSTSQDGFDYYEVIYYRKCWNIRMAIVSTLDKMPDGSHKEMTRDCCDFPINKDEVKRVLNVVKRFDDKKVWNSSMSIWTYKEIKSTLKEHKKNLKTLLKQLNKHPNLEVIWEDSY